MSAGRWRSFFHRTKLSSWIETLLPMKRHWTSWRSWVTWRHRSSWLTARLSWALTVISCRSFWKLSSRAWRAPSANAAAPRPWGHTMRANSRPARDPRDLLLTTWSTGLVKLANRRHERVGVQLLYAPTRHWKDGPTPAFWNGPVFRIAPALEKALNEQPWWMVDASSRLLRFSGRVRGSVLYTSFLCVPGRLG